MKIPLDMEEWRDIPGFPDYEASMDGKIRSWKKSGVGKGRRTTPRMLTGIADKSGYASMSLGRDNGRVFVHHAVALAFLGSRPAGMSIDHINRSRLDNRPSNLRYATVAQQFANRRAPRGERNYKSKLTDPQRAALTRMITSGAYSQYLLADSFGTSRSNVARIARTLR